MENQETEYRLLSRLQMDCDYFLGNGNRYIKHLWADTVCEHINEMKRLYNILRIKPEWISFEEILSYELKML